jgi:DedD protein
VAAPAEQASEPAVPPPAPLKEKPPVSAKSAPVQPVVPAKPPAEKPRAAETAKSVRGNWFVQVGAFAQEANAQKTLATLKAAGLPTTSDTQVGKNGRLTRVRVGPFASEAGAEQAAAQVRALELPAVLVKL